MLKLLKHFILLLLYLPIFKTQNIDNIDLQVDIYQKYSNCNSLDLEKSYIYNIDCECKTNNECFKYIYKFLKYNNSLLNKICNITTDNFYSNINKCIECESNDIIYYINNSYNCDKPSIFISFTIIVSLLMISIICFITIKSYKKKTNYNLINNLNDNVAPPPYNTL